MNLFIMRHGPAEDSSPSGGDADRALTKTGADRVRHVAQALRHEGSVPAFLYSSPLVRALQTANIVADVIGSATRGEEIVICDALLPDGDATAFAWRLASQAGPPVMFVGHEPQLTDLVGRLLGERAPVAMQKAMVVALELMPNERTATLQFVLDPKTLVFTRR